MRNPHIITHEDTMIELSGPEGFGFEDLKVTGWRNKYGVVKVAQAGKIKLFVEVVGLVDELAPSRNWGVEDL